MPTFAAPVRTSMVVMLVLCAGVLGTLVRPIPSNVSANPSSRRQEAPRYAPATLHALTWTRSDRLASENAPLATHTMVNGRFHDAMIPVVDTAQVSSQASGMAAQVSAQAQAVWSMCMAQFQRLPGLFDQARDMVLNAVNHLRNMQMPGHS